MIKNKIRQNTDMKLGVDPNDRELESGYKFIQKGVDMKLGIDLVEISFKHEIDQIILIAADSDFQYAVQRAQKYNMKVCVAYFPDPNITKEFLNTFDEKIILTDMILNECKL